MNLIHRIASNMAEAAFIFFGLIFLNGCDMQKNMLYYPDDRVPLASELKAVGLEFWPATGNNSYRGYVSTRKIDHVKGTVIVFHGNAGTAADRDYYLQPLGLLGYRVILAEYPGYGGRCGEIGGKQFVADARETFRIAFRLFGDPVYLLGESLGCGVVAGTANDLSLTVAGVVLVTPWNTLLDVAKHHYPYLPVGWLMEDKYNNSENLKSYTRRIAVLGAELDEVIPIGHAQKLFDLLPPNKRMWTIARVGHNDWMMAMDTEKWREIMDFANGQGQFAK